MARPRRDRNPSRRLAATLAGLALWGAATLAPAYEVVETKHGATLKGRVSFQGTPPAAKRFEVDKDQEVCGEERSLEAVTVSLDGWLRDAVIVLEGVTRGKPFPAQRFAGPPPGQGEFRYGAGKELSLEVRTKGCSFGPYTGVLAPDAPIGFLNEDPVRHTLHTFAAFGPDARILRTVHNMHIHAGTEETRTFASGKLRDSRVVRIICDRHAHMQNWLYVVTSPYFAFTDEAGAFVIDRIPPGRYELVAWHPELGRLTREISVTENDAMEEHFEFSAP